MSRNEIVFRLRLTALLAGLACCAGAGADTTTATIAPASAVPGPTPGTLAFNVTRSGDTSFAAVYAYHTADGTALAGTHYSAVVDALYFAPGATTATIPVPIAAGPVSTARSFSLVLDGAAGVGAAPVAGPAATITTAGQPNNVAYADFNGDGRADLVIAHTVTTTATVLMNTTTTPGVPTFAAQAFASSSFLYGVATGDLNGDGRADFATARASGIGIRLNTTAPGAATASFAAEAVLTQSGVRYAIAFADVNGDGRADLVTAEAAGAVGVRLNTTAPGATSASFSALQQFPAGALGYAIAAADVNGDGRADIAVTSYSDATVSVLLNTTAPGAASASFVARQEYATGAGAASVALGDLNGDGRPDLAVSNHDASTVSVLLNTTAPGASLPGFAPKVDIAAGTDPTWVALGDLNGDGRPDLVTANEVATVSVLINLTAPGSPLPRFAPKVDSAMGFSCSSVALPDVDGDGLRDLVTTNYNAASVSVRTLAPAIGAGPPQTRFTSAQPFAAGSSPHSVAHADLNGDGRPDLAVANAGSSNVSVMFGTAAPGAGSAGFGTQQAFAVAGTPYAVAAGDLNGDGRPDLVAANYDTANVSVLIDSAAPGATTPSFLAQQPFTVGLHPQSVALADFNADGRADLVTANTFPASTVSVLLNTMAAGATTASFATQQTFGTAATPYAVVPADVNGDGRPDLIVAAYDAAAISVLLNTTAPGAAIPSFATQAPFASVSGSHPFALAAADVNGDGRPDAIVTNYSPDSVSVLLNYTAPGASAPVFGAQDSFATGGYPFSVAASDLNGDGRPDLVVGNYFDGTASVLYNTTAIGAASSSFAAQATHSVGQVPYSVTAADVNGDGKPDLAFAYVGGASVQLNTQYLAARSGSPATGTLLGDGVFADGFE